MPRYLSFEMFLNVFLYQSLIMWTTSSAEMLQEDVEGRDIWGCDVGVVTGDYEEVPFRVCSSPVESADWRNESVIETFVDLETELECWAACEQEPACHFYSFNSQQIQVVIGGNKPV